MRKYRVLNIEEKLELSYVNQKNFYHYEICRFSEKENKLFYAGKNTALHIIYVAFRFLTYVSNLNTEKKAAMLTGSQIENCIIVHGSGNKEYINNKMSEAAKLYQEGFYIRSIEVLNELNFNWCEEGEFLESFKKDFHALMAKNIEALQSSTILVA